METERTAVSPGRDGSGERTLSQSERFKVMTAAERFDWWVGMLQLTVSLATPEVRDQWRKHRW